MVKSEVVFAEKEVFVRVDVRIKLVYVYRLSRMGVGSVVDGEGAVL